MREGARYGLRHLTAINNDVQTESSYSRKMRADMKQAIVLLRAAPAAIDALGTLLGAVEAGEIEEPRLIAAARRANAAYQLAHNPDRADTMEDVL
jgi:hypothetical protein